MRAQDVTILPMDQLKGNIDTQELPKVQVRGIIDIPELLNVQLGKSIIIQSRTIKGQLRGRIYTPKLTTSN